MTTTATTTQRRIGNNNVSDDGKDRIEDDNQKHTCFRFIILASTKGNITNNQYRPRDGRSEYLETTHKVEQN